MKVQPITDTEMTAEESYFFIFGWLDGWRGKQPSAVIKKKFFKFLKDLDE